MIVEAAWLCSVVFRHAYLRQKIENLRTTGLIKPGWFEQIIEIDDDFWSFLK